MKPSKGVWGVLVLGGAVAFWAVSAAAGEGGKGGGPGGPRGRSGVADRNQDPRGPHAGLTHRQGQIDQGWHRGQDKEKPGQAGQGGGKCGKGGIGKRMRQRWMNMFRQGGQEAGKLRCGLRMRLRHRLMMLRRRMQMQRAGGGGFRGMPAEPPGGPSGGKTKGPGARQRWDRGLHRGQAGGKPGGGGGFGRDREKWDDYQDKPGQGNQEPKGHRRDV